MADDKRKTGKPDRIRINVNQDHERRYWCKAFGITLARLQEAVAKVGPMVENVRQELIERIEKAR
jgi:hypothetical protein